VVGDCSTGIGLQYKRMILNTPRLTLRTWRYSDKDSFAELNSDPEVMADLGGPYDRAKSDAKFEKYLSAYESLGFSRWVVEDSDNRFLGYAGIMPSPIDHPLKPHVEVGWRLVRSAWGKGYATEAARAALDDAFKRHGFAEILSYTSADNKRSQAVMTRLGLERDVSLDFSHRYDIVIWSALVWKARNPAQ
jgi:RimJ/RimL family protein N-acetyltransferase